MEGRELQMISASELYSMVDDAVIMETYNYIENNNISLKPATKFSVLIKKQPFAPKDFLRVLARLKGYAIDENTFFGGKANIPFEKLGYRIIDKNDYPFFNGSVLQPQIKKYQYAIDNTDWLKIEELYKFKFVQWIEEQIDFKSDTNLQIQQKIKESQQIAYNPEISIKGVNFIQTIIRYQDEYLTLEDIIKLKKIVGEELTENKENLTLSFSSFPKTSAFLSFFAPEKYIAYDGESLPAYEFLAKGNSDFKTPPKRDYKAFQFYQIFYQNVKRHLKNSHLDTTVFQNLLGVETLSELQWNFIAQDFLLFVTRRIMNNTYKKLDITGHRIYKISMGTFLKSSEYKHIDPINDFEKNNLVVMHEDTTNNQAIEFRDNLKEGDFIYLTYGQERLGFIAKITSPTLKVNQKINIALDDKWLCREVEIIQEPIVNKTTDLKEKNGWLPSGYTTFKEIKDIDSANEILFNKYYHIEIVDGKAPQKLMETQVDNEIFHPLNQILYGAPGTGKTYLTKRIAVEIIDGHSFRDENDDDRKVVLERYKELSTSNQIHFTTFHQSISYEDFIEGIKPENVDDQIKYEVKDGIFKQISQYALFKNETNFNEAYNSLLKEILEKENDFLILKTPKNKQFRINVNSNDNFNLFTTENINKQGTLTKEKLLKQFNGQREFNGWEGYVASVINYLKEKHQLKIVESTVEKKFVLIIDEINRGNISSIFGELITLIEDDKRKGNKEEIEVILPYSHNKFSVPNNLYIIGTMNTADRSVEALDTALRRRFSFKEVPPNPELLEEVEYQDVNLVKMLSKINERIEVLIDKDHKIGHSYFFEVKNLEDLKLVLTDKIIPLLEEYFYGDFGKIGLVLGEIFVKGENVKNTDVLANHSKYDKADFLSDKTLFSLNPISDMSVKDFISIYDDSKDE